MTDAESEDVAQIEGASSRVRSASRYDKVRNSLSQVDSKVNTCILESVESFVVDARSCKQYAKSNKLQLGLYRLLALLATSREPSSSPGNDVEITPRGS